MTKVGEFLWYVQTMIAADGVGVSADGDLRFVLAQALKFSKKVPDDKGAAEAGDEFMQFYRASALGTDAECPDWMVEFV